MDHAIDAHTAALQRTRQRRAATGRTAAPAEPITS